MCPCDGSYGEGVPTERVCMAIFLGSGLGALGPESDLQQPLSHLVSFPFPSQNPVWKPW